jgi:hypothetical protein
MLATAPNKAVRDCRSGSHIFIGFLRRKERIRIFLNGMDHAPLFTAIARGIVCGAGRSGCSLVSASTGRKNHEAGNGSD